MDKTVFVLDHTQYFSISSEAYISTDFALKKSSPDSGGGGLPQFSKSLWTYAAESAAEYCRVVWDLFPREKLVRFIVSDSAAHIVNTWSTTTQNSSHVMNAMALVSCPQRNTQTSEYSVIHGLRAAIEALAEPTEAQEKDVSIENKGRVICITSARDNSSMKSLEDIFHTVLAQQNSLSTAQNRMLNINHCHLVIINVVPLNVESLVTNHPIFEHSATLSSEIHTVAAPDIANKLMHLMMSHYDLASTTVTGIPMKEEQNANSSANYDVEILHSRRAHTSIFGTLLPTSIKEGSEYETVTLKWSTPRGSGGSSDTQPCVSMDRVTPVDVTSRPSACLINFLLNGRSVLLEMPKKTGGKITSHLLSARSGEIFIHALQTTRSLFDDIPSITEVPGGRITDYRVADYAAFIKQHRLYPLKLNKPKIEDNLVKVRERMYRRTKYFPLTTSSSLVYSLQRNLSWLTQFLRKITKEDMDANDELQCLQYINELYTSAKLGEVLPFQNISASRIKGQKKVDQYKLLCIELEYIVRNYGTTSHHKAIIEKIQSVRLACGDSTVKMENDSSRDSKSVIRATTDSPLSPPHSLDNASTGMSLLKNNKRTSNSNRTLFDIYTAAERQSIKRDFVGRIITQPGQIAKLYADLPLKDKESNTIKDEISNLKS